VEIGRVWNICCVEKKRSRFETKNSFCELPYEDEEEDEGDGSWQEEEKESEVQIKPKGFKKIPRKKWRNIKAADYDDGTWIQTVGVEKGQGGHRMCLGFQVAEVKKPLVAVKRIVEKGNYVKFGPKEEDNYIENLATGDKMQLKPNGKGSYLMEVCFVGGGRTEITVDSGAEESVCPWGWGSQFETKHVDKLMNFKNASGGFIEHYGKRDVHVVSPF
jgi:hypothetical protein